MDSKNFNYGVYRQMFLKEIQAEIQKYSNKNKPNKKVPHRTQEYLKQITKLEQEVREFKISNENLFANKDLFKQLKTKHHNFLRQTLF